MQTPVQVRPLRASDESFIRSSWFSSYWKNGQSPAGVPFSVVEQHQPALIGRLLERCEVQVVHPTGLEEHICGYAVVERGLVLHWVYVRSAYRRLGIASGLVPGGVKYYSHRVVGPGREFVKKLDLMFNPYALLEAP